MHGEVHDVLASVVSGLSNRKVNSVGVFRTSTGDSCVVCAPKANDGYLSLLEKSFMFIHKPLSS